jgi:hypothetical protein
VITYLSFTTLDRVQGGDDNLIVNLDDLIIVQQIDPHTLELTIRDASITGGAAKARVHGELGRLCARLEALARANPWAVARLPG